MEPQYSNNVREAYQEVIKLTEDESIGNLK